MPITKILQKLSQKKCIARTLTSIYTKECKSLKSLVDREQLDGAIAAYAIIRTKKVLREVAKELCNCEKCEQSIWLDLKKEQEKND